VLNWRGVAILLTIGLTHSLAAQQVIPIAVERRFAEAARVGVGDTISISTPGSASHPATVVAIYEPHADPATIMRRDYYVRMHLGDLAALLGQPDRVDRIGVAVQPGTNIDSVASRLNAGAFGFDVYASREIATRTSTTFKVVSRFHRAIAIISILASTVFLLCLMLLKVESRRRDVAVLRFTGISRRTIFVSLVLEAGVIALIGSLLGVALAAGSSRVVNLYYQRAFETPLIFSLLTLDTVLLAVGLSVVLGIGAGMLAAWRLVKLPPVELWSRAA
jgi:putative ABC transport system permease protein